jgi:hypothetical protein
MDNRDGRVDWIIVDNNNSNSNKAGTFFRKYGSQQLYVGALMNEVSKHLLAAARRLQAGGLDGEK